MDVNYCKKKVQDTVAQQKKKSLCVFCCWRWTYSKETICNTVKIDVGIVFTINTEAERCLWSGRRGWPGRLQPGAAGWLCSPTDKKMKHRYNESSTNIPTACNLSTTHSVRCVTLLFVLPCWTGWAWAALWCSRGWKTYWAWPADRERYKLGD